MTHEDIQDLLEGYVDDRLDRLTRKQVDDHLKTCEECRSILDEVAPVDISALGPSRYDERAMRSTVRRSIFRTAWNTAIILLAGWILLWVFSAFIYQPLVIGRGDRGRDAAQVTIDMTSMVNPGAVVIGGHIQSGLLDRRMTFDVVLPVGSTSEDIGPVEVILGTFSLTGPDGVNPWPYLGPQEFQDAAGQVGHLGDNTVTTLQLDLEEPITIGEAQAIADDPDHDIRVTWAGFDLRDSETGESAIAPGGILGYGTCLATLYTDDMLNATSAGFTNDFGHSPSSIESALNAVIAGLGNLEDHPEWLTNLTFHESEPGVVTDAVERLRSEPEVRTLVVTGPSDEIAGFLASYRGNTLSAQVLAVDFYNWAPGLCGR